MLKHRRPQAILARLGRSLPTEAPGPAPPTPRAGRFAYNLLFRWFVGLNMDDPIWDPTVFTKNRQRLLGGEVATAFLERVVAQARHPAPRRSRTRR